MFQSLYILDREHHPLPSFEVKAGFLKHAISALTAISTLDCDDLKLTGLTNLTNLMNLVTMA